MGGGCTGYLLKPFQQRKHFHFFLQNLMKPIPGMGKPTLYKGDYDRRTSVLSEELERDLKVDLFIYIGDRSLLDF